MIFLLSFEIVIIFINKKLNTKNNTLSKIHIYSKMIKKNMLWKTISIYYNKLQKNLFQNLFV
jgi:hypothetical protein